MPRSPEPQNTGSRYSSPLPPIGTSPEETHTNPSQNIERPYRSNLPDPWPVLDESEQLFVRNIASMGFPNPRVSRAVQRLGMKEREVMDFLLSTNELSEIYPPDNVEVALVYNAEKAKAIEFLELVKTFKEYGFKEDNIMECLQVANNDSEKALEYLMSLPSS
ncbi:Ubiquitin-associated protein 1 [Desmophyllum pertusum]|uniref:Ubiquitin-associated protein 1 n=1 Tax=Desmophyllum pertusum TaxID=174260 RepID=A0A9X0CM80_9CNID|nr:Ubiquitin-associated protein 1 [Desmophyllum pertusum]